jgi:mRNA-degrading endonuclease toxin of MazEF toxin-antitoxin module
MLGEDCMCLQLTSQLHHKGILIHVEDLVDGALKKQSMLLVPKNFTLHQSVLTKYLARIRPALLDEVMTRLCKDLGCV